MNRVTFNDGFAALVAAFPLSDRSTAEQQEIYFQMLKEIPDEIWTDGITKCLKNSTFFPTIHDIGVACFGERKEEWVWKCDPWRTIQNYKVKIEAETWEERMQQVLKPALPAPAETRLLTAPEKQPPPKGHYERGVLSRVAGELAQREKEKAAEDEKERIAKQEERRKELQAQARLVAFNERGER